MAKSISLQEPYLNALRKDRIPVSIFLVNGIKLQGYIESFDAYVVLLRSNVSQMIYKHAISTIVPSRSIRLNLVTARALVKKPNSRDTSAHHCSINCSPTNI